MGLEHSSGSRSISEIGILRQLPSDKAQRQKVEPKLVVPGRRSR